MDGSKGGWHAAPGHPLQFLNHRASFDLGPNYKNYGDWLFDKSKTLYRKNLLAHFGCVNAIEFSKNGNLLASGGDDRRVLLWNIDKAVVSKEEPVVLRGEHASNVFSLDFSCSSTKIFSAGNDEQVIVHDIATGAPLDTFQHDQPVYGVSADPINESFFCSACDDGRILIYDIRDSVGEPFCLAKSTSAFHSVMFHPIEPRLVITANSKEGVASWDVRMPKRPFMKYGTQNSTQCCMSARFNRLGNQILVLRRRLPPILYSTDSPSHKFQFNHRGYYNSCTMKSCTFGGMNDQFVLSGSDNFDLHLWKIPKPGSDQWVNRADMVLRGHRSIVNQVRFNYTHNLIASSGVEKIVKLWSPFPLPEDRGGKTEATVMNESERRIYTQDDYVSLVMQAGQPGQGHFMSLTYEAGRKTTREDSRMLAFFDALVQRDINGMSEEESDTFPETSYTNTVYSTPESSQSENEDEDSNPPDYRSFLSSSTSSLTNNRSGDLNGSHTGNILTSSSPSSTGTNLNPQEPLPSDESEALTSPVQEVNSEDLSNPSISQSAETRHTTANIITKLILKKESSRRKLQSKPDSTSNVPGVSDTESSESDSNIGSDSRSSCSPSSSAVKRRRRSYSRKPTTSSYSSSRKECRKQLLRAKRRELMPTPVYESSRNVTDASNPSMSTGETSFDRISDLMTRNQTRPLTDSSSSSSSSETSSSDDQPAPKSKKKLVNTAKKSRAVLSTGSSSSDTEVDTQNPGSVAENTRDSSTGSQGCPKFSVELKRKRRQPCKLKEACKALLQKFSSTDNPDVNESEDESIPRKVFKKELSENTSTTSTGTSADQISFKKFSKQKDRNYRKGWIGTPPDSGIDVSKEQEPCCSKSFAHTGVPENGKQKSSKKECNRHTDDLGFGQIETSDDSE